MSSARLLYGVGINDADYCVIRTETVDLLTGGRKQLIVWVCPYYRVWTSMLKRCYSAKYQEKYPTYKGCVVCEEWHLFSNFKAWMEIQKWEGKQLDKDILFTGNKVYSPYTCVFVTRIVNGFVIESDATRGEWPIGVYYVKNRHKFMAQCSNPFIRAVEYLGLFLSPEQAHHAWLARKLELAMLLAAEQDDIRVAKALVGKYENYGSESLNSEEKR